MVGYLGWKPSPKFFSPMVRAKPLPHHLEKVVFYFFFNKRSHSTCAFESFSSIFCLHFRKESFPSWFWEYWCSVFDPISLVNENNHQFCIFIVKKCHSPCDSYAFSSFKWKSFPFGFTFSFDNFIWIIKKYHFPCDFDALFQIFLKIFDFHLFCKYIFLNRDFKWKTKITFRLPSCPKKVFVN